MIRFRRQSRLSLVLPGLALAASASLPAQIPRNWRDIATGSVIPDEEYADQPYIVKCDDGAWLCAITTSNGHEGAASQHVVATRSTDFGRTWSSLVAIEAVGPPESSYVTVLKTPGGRLYAFYNYNQNNLRAVKRTDGKMEPRVDTLGAFVFKFSDDHGQTWSPARYEIPIRETAIDRENVYGGNVRFFWHVGRPLLHGGAAYVTLHKVGGFGPTFIDRSEGNFLRSDNLLAERDPAGIRWQTLPEGDIGLRSPRGPIAEEQSIVALSDGTLYCVFRTATDHPGHAYSRDGGRTWTPPAFMTYGPGARKVKHTRAAVFVWRAANGRFLCWYHNHGGTTYHNQRNPAWIAAGREVDTDAGRAISWSEPEILLYDNAPEVRMSYPDFVEDAGRYFVTETQKTIARVHEIPAEFIELLWQQDRITTVARRGVVAESGADPIRDARSLARPELPDLQTNDGEGGGFTIDFRVKFESLDPGQTLLNARDEDGNGFAVTTTDRGTLQLSLRGPFGPVSRSPF
ncbi:MAG: sialidase family protein, partial [Opitutaceae bacterium]